MRRISPRSILSAIGLSVCLLIIIFIVNNLNAHTNDIEPPAAPVKCDCPSLPPPAAKTEAPAVAKVEVPVVTKTETPKTEAPAAPKVDTATTTQTTPPLPPCTPVGKDVAVQRAIIIYYPHHQSEYFFPEVRWYVYG